MNFDIKKFLTENKIISEGEREEEVMQFINKISNPKRRAYAKEYAKWAMSGRGGKFHGNPKWNKVKLPQKDAEHIQHLLGYKFVWGTPEEFGVSLF